MVQDKQSIVRKVLIVTLILNILVIVLKETVGLMSGSLSLQAETLHSVTDSASNIVGLIANQLCSPVPDREHPYGHQKFEALGALGVAAFLCIASFEILREAIERIVHGRNDVNITVPELWVLLIVLAINIFIAFYERTVGQRIKSRILIADAKHTMSDIWVTITVLIGLIGIWQAQELNLPQLRSIDLILTFPVAFFIFTSSWELFKTNISWLVDEIVIAPEEIYQIVMEVPGVNHCYDIYSRGLLGQQIFIEIKIVVSTSNIKAAHKIAKQAEYSLHKYFDPVRVLIQIEQSNEDKRSNLNFADKVFKTLENSVKNVSNLKYK